MRLKLARVVILLAVPLTWLISISTGWANVFEIKGVAVDVTADNAAQARSEAIVRGQHEAFKRLLERLVLLHDIKILPKPGSFDITEFVSDFAISEEKTSTVRYLAKLNVRFKAEPVRRFLDEWGVKFAETRSKPVLVLPVLQEANNVLLWEETNSWLKTWDLRVNRDGLIRIMLPKANESDVLTLNLGNVLDGNVELLSELASRYGAGDTLVSYLRFGLNPKSGNRRLKLLNIRYSLFKEPVTDEFLLDLRPGESIEAALIRGADSVLQKLQEEWKFKNLLTRNKQGIGTFTVPISGLRDWLNIKQRINNVSIVRRVELVLISLDEVRINLHYVGDHEQLRTALQQADLTSIQEDKEWVLYNVTVVPPDKL